MGGQHSLTNDEPTFRNVMGVGKDKEIKWQYGTTDIQQDGWSCGYRVMHGMVAWLSAMRNAGGFRDNLEAKSIAPTLKTSYEDVLRSKELWGPAFYAHAKGWLCFVPDGIFPKPTWDMDPTWDNNIQPFPERSFSSSWTDLGVIQNLLVKKGNVRLYGRKSRRPQGERQDPRRWFAVRIKSGAEEAGDEFVECVDDVEEVLYMQCQCSRHHKAMLTVNDFFNGLRPWEKFTEPKTAAGKRFWETYVQKTESDKKVREASVGS